MKHPNGLSPCSSLIPAGRSGVPLLLAMLASTFATTAAHAQWSATILRAPSTDSHSTATCVWGNRQAGYYDDGYSHPVMWNGTLASMTPLAEPGPDSGAQVYGIDEHSAVGNGYIRTSDTDGYYAGLLWNAAGDQVVQLVAPDGFEPEVNGVSGNTQVGRVNVGDSTVPCLWHGTTDSWTNLLPDGFLGGECTSVDGNQQAGAVYDAVSEQACIWSGTAASFVSLHPAAWYGSVANGISNGQQAGEVYNEEGSHAAFWNGTAASFVDLHPAGATRSAASGISLGRIAGEISLPNGQDHAAYWASATAESFVDLHTYLPAEYEYSSAYGIWTDGTNVVRIVGEAERGAPNYESVAVMWTFVGGGCVVGNSCSVALSPQQCAGVYLGAGRICPAEANCDIAIYSPRESEDCDGDLRADACAGPAQSADCNGNSVPDSCEALDFSAEHFDMGQSLGYILNGSAFIENDVAVLTPADFSQFGSIVHTPFSAEPLSRLRAIFDFRVTDASVPPADGFSFALLDADFHDTSTVFGEDGPAAHSIAVKFNTYANSLEEGSNSMDILYNGVSIARTTSLPLQIADGSWHRAIVDLSPAGTVTVKLATFPGDVATVFDAVQLPGYSPFVASVGFGGRTGAAYSRQMIDNIRIGVPSAADADGDGALDACLCPADFNQDGGVDGGDVQSFFASWEQGLAAADVNLDGGIDGGDVQYFFSVWEAGGCF
ncbi:MAG: hypothetical protein JSR77_11545 [Planctomycetes bacterium]|nr:hypothetical protein [Planctomycetota bacterium]